MYVQTSTHIHTRTHIRTLIYMRPRGLLPTSKHAILPPEPLICPISVSRTYKPAHGYLDAYIPPSTTTTSSPHRPLRTQ
jgi:hypothetical protein